MAPDDLLDPRKEPKRLLSIDGGGLRGVLAAEVLVEIERQLAERTPSRPRIADHFHLIGGTSTGSILAAGSALRVPASDLRDFYLSRGPRIFRKVSFLRWPWHRYGRARLVRGLKDLLGPETRLGSDRLRTLLMVVAKNVGIGEPWFFLNDPAGRFFEANKDLLLWQLVRASCAAPTFFPPEVLEVPDESGARTRQAFVDGGVSTFNNPSFQLFMEATDDNYHLRWRRGPADLLLFSVGTGFAPNAVSPEAARRMTLLGWGPYAIQELMDDAGVQQDFLVRLLAGPGLLPPPKTHSDTLAAVRAVERAVEAVETSAAPAASALTYRRFGTSFTRDRMAELGLPGIDPEGLEKMDDPSRLEDLRRVGEAVAKEQVRLEDFRAFFPCDPPA